MKARLLVTGLIAIVVLGCASAGVDRPRGGVASVDAAADEREEEDRVFLIREAAVPEGWPSPTPVGEVRLKQYPAYRAAVVHASDVERAGMDGMFDELFRHIKRNEIKMTAPVEMTLGGGESEATPRRMAFMYRERTLGERGRDGVVEVVDVPEQRVVSVGVRGRYDEQRFREAMERIEAWLAEHAEAWRAAGPPRCLGYNSPFVPWLLRYGEVQVPVEPVKPDEPVGGE